MANFFIFMKKTSDDLTCILDRFENSHAVLLFELSKGKQQELILPKRYLPSDAKETDILHIKVYTDKLAQLDQKEIAKHMLNEILNNNAKD